MRKIFNNDLLNNIRYTDTEDGYVFGLASCRLGLSNLRDILSEGYSLICFNETTQELFFKNYTFDLNLSVVTSDLEPVFLMSQGDINDAIWMRVIRKKTKQIM